MYMYVGIGLVHQGKRRRHTDIVYQAIPEIRRLRFFSCYSFLLLIPLGRMSRGVILVSRQASTEREAQSRLD